MSSAFGDVTALTSVTRSSTFSSFITVAVSLSRTFASLTGPCRGWKAFVTGDDSRDEAVLCTDAMELLRQLDLKVTHRTGKGSHATSVGQWTAQLLISPLLCVCALLNSIPQLCSSTT